MKVLVSGSGGLIGSALVRRLRSEGHDVVRLVRPGPAGAADTATWDPAAGRLDPAVLEGADGVVHLAGAGIGDRRWSESYKAELIASRVQGTTAIARAIAEGAGRPVLVSASAVGYYGTGRGDDVLTEGDGPGQDFLGRLCVDWEGATAAAEQSGARVVHIRTGLVLSAAGGVLGRLLPLFRLGLGGKLGSGRQYQSWITRQDEVSAVVAALTDHSLSGAVNLTAPQPVTNSELTSAIASALHRPSLLAVPAPALRLALGREMADETVLAGQRVVPARLQSSGFHFAHPHLDVALRAALQDREK
jgi:uncharacterized protein